MLAAAVHVMGVIHIFRLADGSEQLFLDDFGKAQNRIQWRAQFVAHAGQKFGLGAIGFVGGALGAVEFADQGKQPHLLILELLGQGRAFGLGEGFLGDDAFAFA